MKSNGVMILDFGSQYTKLIARRVREENIYSEIFPHNISLKEYDPAIVDFEQEILNPIRYIRVRAKNMGSCPSWHPGSGNDSWVFIDEITIK